MCIYHIKDFKDYVFESETASKNNFKSIYIHLLKDTCRKTKVNNNKKIDNDKNSTKSIREDLYLNSKHFSTLFQTPIRTSYSPNSIYNNGYSGLSNCKGVHESSNSSSFKFDIWLILVLL